MLSAVPNPAVRVLVARVSPELVFAQVVVRRGAEGFVLRHVADGESEGLRVVGVEELRAVAQFTGGGAFRPLKSAPNLAAGWRCVARDEAELERALSHLYPGAVADWFAAQGTQPPVTGYREFTGRQSGMYRATALLTDAQAAQVGRAGCAAIFCLKRRLWTVDGLPPDEAGEKSMIPCLEPCAVLLEFARKAQRLELEERSRLEIAPVGVGFGKAQVVRSAESQN